MAGRIVHIPLGSSGEGSSEELPVLVLFQPLHPQFELRLVHFHICALYREMLICCSALEMIFFQGLIKKSVKKKKFMGIEELLLHFCIKAER